jgi:lysophospholipase L1-like esterase
MMLSFRRTLSFVAVIGCVSLVLIATNAHAQGTGLRLMAIGDSITAGYRSSTGDGYRGPLWRELTTKGYALDMVGSQRGGVMFDPDNEGYYGYRIDQVAALISAELALYQPNVVLLHIGTNDIGQNYQVSTASSRLAALIDQIVAADPGVTVLVAQLICNSTPKVQSLIDTYNSSIPGIVKARVGKGMHVYVVSMSSLTLADLQDGLHPNDGGYQKMADAWDAGIQHVVDAGLVAKIKLAGVYEIQNQSSTLAVDISGGSTANGASVIQWPYSGNSNQLWNFIPTSGGYYQIKNAYSSLDVNVTGASTEDGATVVQWRYGTQGNDQWLPVRQADGSYAFFNRNSGKLLDNPGGTTHGSQLDQHGKTIGASQKFLLSLK